LLAISKIAPEGKKSEKDKLESVVTAWIPSANIKVKVQRKASTKLSVKRVGVGFALLSA